MAWQICLTDEYGSTSIVDSASESTDAVKRIKTLLTTENVDNALTVDEKKRHWAFFYPEAFDGEELSEDVLYAGKNSKGEHCVLEVSSPSDLVEIENVEGDFKFYLGHLDGGDWYAEDPRGDIVTGFTHNSLQDKSFYFIRKAGS